MKQYQDVLNRIINIGTRNTSRTGVDTLSIFGTQSHYDLLEGFPAITCRRLAFKGVVAELLWFISGSTNNNDLRAMGSHIWDAWATEGGQLGPIYGKQWRSWSGAEGIDQLKELIANLAERPFSRRHVLSAWNPAVLPDETKSHAENVAAGRAVLPPCHTLFQFDVVPASIMQQVYYLKQYGDTYGRRPKKIPELAISCQLYARSQDWPIGTPFNIASYALLTQLIAHQLGYIPADYVHTAGNAHVYMDQIPAVNTMLERVPKPLPLLWLNQDRKTIFDFTPDDIRLINYDPHPPIQIPVAV